MNKIRAGVILPDHMVPAWVRSMLEAIKDSSHAEVTALAFADHSKPKDKSSGKLYELLFKLDRRIQQPAPDPWELHDVRKVLHNTQILGENLHERIARLKAMRLDVLLNLSLDELPKGLLDVARFGVWSLRCNDARVTTNTELGWLEVLNSRSVMFCDIEIQKAETTQVYTGSVLASHSSSFTLNQAAFFWRASAVVPRAFRSLHTQGEQTFLAKTKSANALQRISLPSRDQSMSLAQMQIKKLFEAKFRGHPHQWALMAGKGTNGESFDWKGLSLKVPPRDVNWSDPFILKKQGTSYLFFGEYSDQKKPGRISCAVVENDGDVSASKAALERPYPLSYPFILEHRGEFYMILATAQNRAVEAYRCTRFPDQWEFHKTLMSEVQAVNATFIEYSMRWWMFANVAGIADGDELHLFYADDPLSNNWTSHPLNPVVSDVRFARPAGRVFRRDGGLMRPSQDRSPGYGYAVNFNRIVKMTVHEYEEEPVERIDAPNGNIHAVHTYNQIDDLVVVDALLKK